MQIIIYRGRGFFGSKQARVSWSGLHVASQCLFPGCALVDGCREMGKGLVLPCACRVHSGDAPAALGRAQRWDLLCSTLHLAVPVKIIISGNGLVGFFISDIISLFLCQPSSLLCHLKFFFFFFFFNPTFSFVLGCSRFYNVVVD